MSAARSRRPPRRGLPATSVASRISRFRPDPETRRPRPPAEWPNCRRGHCPACPWSSSRCPAPRRTRSAGEPARSETHAPPRCRSAWFRQRKAQPVRPACLSGPVAQPTRQSLPAFRTKRLARRSPSKDWRKGCRKCRGADTLVQIADILSESFNFHGREHILAIDANGTGCSAVRLFQFLQKPFHFTGVHGYGLSVAGESPAFRSFTKRGHSGNPFCLDLFMKPEKVAECA